MLRVLIVEDNYLVREGSRRLLENDGDFEVVGSIEDASGILDAVATLRPDAVLTDIRMPPSHHMEGIDAALAIRSAHPDVGVVVLSQHSDEVYAFELFKEGTAGLAYLLKERPGDLDELTRALREVVAGRSVIDPAVVEALVGRRVRQQSSLLHRLTPREMDVLLAMAEGKRTRPSALSWRFRGRRSRSTSTPFSPSSTSVGHLTSTVASRGPTLPQRAQRALEPAHPVTSSEPRPHDRQRCPSSCAAPLHDLCMHCMTVSLAPVAWGSGPCGVSRRLAGCSPTPGSPQSTWNRWKATFSTTTTSPAKS